MSLHSYSRIWLHLTWATLERRPLLCNPVAPRLSRFLTDYAAEKGVYMKINFVNPEHIHALVDLPTNMCVEDMMHLFKGGSSHWLNTGEVPGRFAWGRGYGVFSVSHSGVGAVAKYIAEQEQHHRKKTWAEEIKMLVERHGLQWRQDKTVETVGSGFSARHTPP
ncbi:MAG TPA: transposase [Verrucomicrobiae bacterium]|nr:transposase [Verrucomicrobiae bacterium]